MTDAGGIDLWLDWQLQSRPAIVVPYAKSRAETLVEYRIVLHKQSSAGRSRISQGGKLRLIPEVAAPLSWIAVDRQPQDSCSVEVSLSRPGQPPFVRVFECPAQ